MLAVVARFCNRDVIRNGQTYPRHDFLLRHSSMRISDAPVLAHDQLRRPRSHLAII
jgi:hypothetical protein